MRIDGSDSKTYGGYGLLFLFSSRKHERREGIDRPRIIRRTNYCRKYYTFMYTDSFNRLSKLIFNLYTTISGVLRAMKPEQVRHKAVSH